MKQSSIYGPNVVLITDETKSLVLTLQNRATNCTDLPCNPAVNDDPPTGEFTLKMQRFGTAVPGAAEFYSQLVEGNRVTFQFGSLMMGLPRGRYAAQLEQNNVVLTTFEIQLADTGNDIIHVKTTV